MEVRQVSKAMCKSRTGTHGVFRLKLQTDVDGVSRFLVFLQSDESLGFPEVTLAPLTFEVDNVFSIDECAEEVACFKECDGAV